MSYSLPTSNSPEGSTPDTRTTQTLSNDVKPAKASGATFSRSTLCERTRIGLDRHRPRRADEPLHQNLPLLEQHGALRRVHPGRWIARQMERNPVRTPLDRLAFGSALVRRLRLLRAHRLCRFLHGLLRRLFRSYPWPAPAAPACRAASSAVSTSKTVKAWIPSGPVSVRAVLGVFIGRLDSFPRSPWRSRERSPRFRPLDRARPRPCPGRSDDLATHNGRQAARAE